MSIRLDLDPKILDRSHPTPLYHQLKQWLATHIYSGDLPPGSKLPDEFELCERLDVSRGVVRQALTELCYEGLLYRQRGRGTYVAAPKSPVGLIGGLAGTADEAARRGQQIDSLVLMLREAPASDAVASRLDLAPGDPVIELERVRSIDGQRRVLVLTYLPSALVPGLTKRDLSGSASLYRILREDYGLVIVSAVRVVEAMVAGAREARLLRIKRGDPLLVLRSVGRTVGHRPLDFFIAYHRGDSSAFEARLSSPGRAVAHFEHVPLASGSLE